MKRVVLYPGRFQPMLPHHAEVFQHLQGQFPDAEVYMATSNKVEADKSPFNASEKIEIMTKLHGIPEDRILIVSSPYNFNAYKETFDLDNTHAVFVVGGKDMEGDPRFTFKPKKDGSPSYLQMINTTNNENLPMSQRGYVYSAPTVGDNEAASASAFRNSLKNAPDMQSAKHIFTQTFGKFDQGVFDLVYDRIVKDIMESLDILKALAGLSEAPVNFKPGKGPMDYEPGISKKDQKAAADREENMMASDPESAEFTDISPDAMVSVDTGKPIRSKGRYHSIANQLPSGTDQNDPEVKKELFLKLLAKSPEYLLGEINARLSPDDNGLAVSDRLSRIIDNLPEAGVMGLQGDDKSFVLKLVKNALENMELHRADSSDEDEFGELPDPEENMPEESVDFSDIRNEYGIEEADESVEEEVEEVEEVVQQVDEEEPNRSIADDPVKQSDITIAQDQLGIDSLSIGLNAINKSMRGDQLNQKEREQAGVVLGKFMSVLKDPQKRAIFLGMLPGEDDGPRKQERNPDPDARNKEYFGKDAKESFDPQAEQSREDQAYDELVDAYDKGGEDGLCKAIGCSSRELDQEMSEFARDHNLHMDDDRDEIIHGYIEQLVDNADWKDHGEYEESINEAKCGCCGDDPCDCPSDCKGCMEESVDATAEKALEAAMQELKQLAGLSLNETEYWDWDDPKIGYREKDGYDANYSRWRQEAQADRSRNGDKPFSSENEMIQTFDNILMQRGIDISQQKQLSAKIKQDRENEERARMKQAQDSMRQPS